MKELTHGRKLGNLVESYPETVVGVYELKKLQVLMSKKNAFAHIVIAISLWSTFVLYCEENHSRSNLSTFQQYLFILDMSAQPSMASEEGWTRIANTYSSNVGRTSALAAKHLVSLATQASPITPDSHVLDNGAGAGAITFAVTAQIPSAHILATDISASMLSNISSANLPNVSTRVLDARSLTQELEPSSFTHVFNTFMLQTITTPSAAIREMHSVLRPNGVIGIALWGQRNGPFEIWELACRSLDPSYMLPAPFDDPHAWRTCEELKNALSESGFEDVHTEEVSMPFPFPTTEKFLELWFGAKNPAPEKLMSSYKGNIEEVKRAMERISREEYGDGKDIRTWAVLGVGRKV